jgi:hypothetical protein
MHIRTVCLYNHFRYSYSSSLCVPVPRLPYRNATYTYVGFTVARRVWRIDIPLASLYFHARVNPSIEDHHD